MQLLAVVIIIRLILSNCETELRNLKCFQNKNFTNIKILENPLAAQSVRSLPDCNKFCLETVSCLSCAYNSITGSCLLWDKDFIDVSTTNVVDENGWRYYYTVKECAITENTCLTNNGFIYEPETCFCFKYLSTRYLYNDAVSACAAVNANLAKIDRGLIQLKMQNFLDTVSDGEVRIQGLLDNATDIWKYSDGSEIKYFNWNHAGVQPDHRIDEIAIVMRKSQGSRWHDVFSKEESNEYFAAICQMTNV